MGEGVGGSGKERKMDQAMGEQGGGMDVTPNGVTITWKELDNDKVLSEVRYCGYREYAAAIDACDKKLPKALGKTEMKVLDVLKKHAHGKVTPLWSKTVIFGDTVKGLTKTEKAAVVCLVRRGLVKIWKIGVDGLNHDGKHEAGYRHLWECMSAQ